MLLLQWKFYCKHIKNMKSTKLLLILSLSIIITSCLNEDKQQKKEPATQSIKEMKFEELFQKIEPENFNDNVFALLNSAGVLTSGNDEDFNSMTIGWGGWGIYFNEPATWCFLRANRYTLEFIRKTKTYTISFFDKDYEKNVMHFGKSSGRNTDKMGTHELNSVFTPLNNVSYKEANIIIECELMSLTTVNPEDYYFENNKKFIEEAFLEANDYHKIVFGKITDIWVRK